MDRLRSELTQKYGSRVKQDEPLFRYTTYKIGGPADIFFEAKTSDELCDALVLARTHHVPCTVIGGGSNILIADSGLRGLVVKNTTSGISFKGVKGTVTKGETDHGIVFVEADSGVIFNKLVRFTVEEGLEGIEMHLGLPGTVGGALYMNSKWTRPEGYVGDAVYQATIVTSLGEIKSVPQRYFHFGYDTSSIQKTGDVVLRVVFAFRKRPKEVLWQTANLSIAHRRESQPQGVFTAGCVFKNISRAQAIALATPNLTTSAGFLVDHAGCKGMHVGDAEVSSVHANFIVNKGRAKASDVVELISLVRDAVRAKYGVKLEEEIVRMGDFQHG